MSDNTVHDFIIHAQKMFGENAVMTRKDINKVVDTHNLVNPSWFIDDRFRVGHGKYQLPNLNPTKENETIEINNEGDSEVMVKTNLAVDETQNQENWPPMLVANEPQKNLLKLAKLFDESRPEIPAVDSLYCPFGHFDSVMTVIGSNMFFPIFIHGPHGTGKTKMVEQVCAKVKRKIIRINISNETDQYDLIGGHILVDGNTVNQDGPVLVAMRQGAILLLDEVDRGSEKLLCIQGIMEGKPYYNKKTGEVITPAPGFNIIATANTKGFGSDDGRYLAKILDEAFLERFSISFEQGFPSKEDEMMILTKKISTYSKDQNKLNVYAKFALDCVNWADKIRKSFLDDAISEVISTRRLLFIMDAYYMFNDAEKAIALCTNRFEDSTKKSFMDMFELISNKKEEHLTPPAAGDKNTLFKNFKGA